MSLGLYISVPFCRTKCSYCNFASDVFSRAVFQRYVDRLCSEINSAHNTANQMGGRSEPSLDSIYLGGGTPTVLESADFERIFRTIWQIFDKRPETEITVECAPGTLTREMISTLQGCGVNRVSLGVQSFVDAEAAAVGRLHKRTTVLDDIAHLRDAGISNINLDLIAGLPHQTTDSWQASLDDVIASGVPHASVYMLEVDEDSRLGRELIAGGTRYHAHFVPDEDLTAGFYETACEQFNLAGLHQYEISNFARDNAQSRHNLKYWTRQPYLGFGVDAHSMLPALDPKAESVRFSNPDSPEKYLAAQTPARSVVSRHAALEETFFLGLRLTSGISLDKVEHAFGREVVLAFAPVLQELQQLSLLARPGNRLCLTPRGRMLSNEVFERFISLPTQ